MKTEKKYKINEIFYSIQGEGLHAGTPAVFIRFSGCNLRCFFCDTEFMSFQEMTAEQIANAAAELYPSDYNKDKNTPMIILTGGEPLLQADDNLIFALEIAFYRCFIAVETNGTCKLPFKDHNVDWITCSPKEGYRFALKSADELKIVYIGQNVEPWLKKIHADYYFLQPCDYQDAEKNKRSLQATIDYVTAHPHWSLSAQLHKLLNFK